MILFSIWFIGAIITGIIAGVLYGLAGLISLGFPTTTARDIMGLFALWAGTTLAWPIMVPWTVWSAYRRSKVNQGWLTDHCDPENACLLHGRCWTHSEWVDEQFDNSDQFH